ncbi:MAG: NUDIX domain-containing protein [Acidobacteriota bacterium]
MAFEYRYPRPALTVDCAVFGYDAEELRLLLIRRGLAPFQGAWALPGGFVQMEETLDTAAMRELREETGVTCSYLEQLYTFGGVERDPRERVVTVAYFALVNLTDHPVHASTDASAAAWFAVDDLPTLAFDHDEIVDVALERLRAKVRYRPIGFELLPRKFTLTQLQRLYEVVLSSRFDKRNFRKRVLAMGLLEDLDEVEQDVAHRAARLYRFDGEAYRELSERGFEFSL